MVAKMPRSTSFLMTKLAFTSSFSESSLTVMPSEMVMSRLMGGGAANSRRVCGRRILLFRLALAIAARRGRGSAVVLRDGARPDRAAEAAHRDR